MTVFMNDDLPVPYSPSKSTFFGFLISFRLAFSSFQTSILLSSSEIFQRSYQSIHLKHTIILLVIFLSYNDVSKRSKKCYFKTMYKFSWADILVNTFVCWTIRNWTIKISSINIKFNYSKDLFYTLRTLTFNRFMDSAK